MDRLRLSIYILLILLILLVNVNTYAATIHVPKEELTIQSGIDAAKDGDTVLVADGIYKDEGNVNLDFNGKKIIVKSESGPKSTIITCSYQPNTRGFSFTNKETVDSVVEGFTIRNGIHINGGGIYIHNSSPTIKNCIVEWNRAIRDGRWTGHGGGIYAKNSDVLIMGCTINNNRTASYGGGVFFEGNREDDIGKRVLYYLPRVIDCTISHNNGSGIHSIEDVRTTIKNTKVSQNSNRGIVAAIFSGRTFITNSVISQNTGGGVECNEFSVLKIQDSIIKQNTGNIGGGIYGSPSAIIEVTNCIIVQNIAQRWGGGIGISPKWGDTKITNCTISRNIAEQKGGGVFASSEGALFILSKSIVWGNNSNGTHDELFGRGSRISIRHSDIKDGLEEIRIRPDGDRFIYEDNIDSDPQFVNADRNDFRLRPDSPAVGMGANALTLNSLSVRPVGKKTLKWGELKQKNTLE